MMTHTWSLLAIFRAFPFLYPALSYSVLWKKSKLCSFIQHLLLECLLYVRYFSEQKQNLGTGQTLV